MYSEVLCVCNDIRYECVHVSVEDLHYLDVLLCEDKGLRLVRVEDECLQRYTGSVSKYIPAAPPKMHRQWCHERY